MRSFVFLGMTAALFAGVAMAQDEPAEADGCEPGFNQFIHQHGARLNFTCRTRVIACPQRDDHYAAIVPDKPLELEGGTQFSYRCLYTRYRR